MDIPLIILISFVAGLEGSIDIKHKTFIGFISDRFLPKQVSSWIFGVSSWMFGGTILVLAIYLSIRVYILLKKK
jgi:hypothetical protein